MTIASLKHIGFLLLCFIAVFSGSELSSLFVGIPTSGLPFDELPTS